MEFEFNPAKSMSNLVKHGISFNDVKQLWLDPKVLVVKAREAAKPRWIAIACIDGKNWSAIFTYRGEQIRLISARRSRAKEFALYES